MGNRSRAVQLRQWGEENTATPGTAVAGDHLSPNTKIMIAPAGDANTLLVPSGYLYQRDSVNGMRWGAGTYDMPWTFGEIYVILNSLFKKVTATGATLTKTRLWTPAVNALDTNQTYSFESGMAGATEKFKYGTFNSMKFKLSKQTMSPITGDVIAQFNGLSTSLTASPTVLASEPIGKLMWNVYTATSFANLTSSPVQVLDHWDVDFSLGPVRTEAAYINSSNQGWDALGIGDPIKNDIKVTVPFDVTGTDYTGTYNLAKKDAGTAIFLRLQAIGNLIEHVVSDFFETLTIDMCLKIIGNPTDTNIGPFVGRTWPTALTVDPTSGKAIEISTLSLIP